MSIHTVSVLSKSYVFDPRPRVPFRIVANRYWTSQCPDEASKTEEGLLTLVLLSGHASHKEQWEPMIQRLFQHQEAAPRRIHDVWSLDLPNLGDSAILNEKVLLGGYDVFSWEHHARAVHAFLAGLGSGVDVDFSKRRLALVGHSVGGTACILTPTYYPLLKISSLHLVEPFLAAELEGVQNLFSSAAETSDKRRDIWPSSEEAFRSLKARSVMCTWDERVKRTFIEHGLRPLPTAEYPDVKDGVTLKCTRKQEAATYRDFMTSVTAYKYLPHVLKEIPTHITLGTIADYMMDELQQGMLHHGSGGISNFASVTWIPEVGHLMVQTHPDALGDAIWKCLSPKDTMLARL